MRKLAFCFVGLLFVASSAHAARVDVADTSTFGASIAGPTSGNYLPALFTGTSQVFDDGTLLTYMYTLTGFSGGATPLGFFSVAGDWGGSQVLNWGDVTGLTSGAVSLFMLAINNASIFAVLGDSAGGPMYPFGGLHSGETLTFYVQSLKTPELQTAIGIDGGIAVGQAYAPTPEPGTLALIGAGLVGLYGALRRRRKTTIA